MLLFFVCSAGEACGNASVFCDEQVADRVGRPLQQRAEERAGAGVETFLGAEVETHHETRKEFRLPASTWRRIQASSPMTRKVMVRPDAALASSAISANDHVSVQ